MSRTIAALPATERDAWAASQERMREQCGRGSASYNDLRAAHLWSAPTREAIFRALAAELPVILLDASAPEAAEILCHVDPRLAAECLRAALRDLWFDELIAGRVRGLADLCEANEGADAFERDAISMRSAWSAGDALRHCASAVDRMVAAIPVALAALKAGKPKRLLRLPDDPRAVAVLEQACAGAGRSLTTIDDVRDAIDALAARGLVPIEWTHDERIALITQDWRVPALVLRNPGALIAAERLLLDELARCAQEHSSPVGRYVGVRSWESLCAQSYAAERGGYLPHGREPGFASCRGIYGAPRWINATRGIGTSYGSGTELVWCMADQLMTRAPWLVSLYETGLGLWCWREAWADCDWALIVRPGDGLPWPEYDASEAAGWSEKRKTPPA